MPFEKGVGADIKIINEEYGFQVSENFRLKIKFELFNTVGKLRT